MGIEKLFRKAHRLMTARDRSSDKEDEESEAKNEVKEKHKRKYANANKRKSKERKRHSKTKTHFIGSKYDEIEQEKHKPKPMKLPVNKREESEIRECEFTEEAVKERETRMEKCFKRDAKAQEVVNKWVETTLNKGVEGLKKDFQSVKRINPDPSETVVFEANQVTGRNRFKDVPCLDKTRVLIDDSLNNYIHANYVKMALMEKCIICTQAPLDLTVYHFYQMIMREGVTSVIMLCDFVESDRKACTEYYPPTERDAPLVFGDITVICLHTCRMPGEKNVRFTLLGLKDGSGKRQIVRHMRWKDWPEHGVPDISLTPMHIFTTVRGSKGPIVIHCTDGVSRTGTMIAIEYILEKMLRGVASNDSVEMIKEIRKQRALCVHNEMQYIYIHREILEYLQKRQVIDITQRLLEFVDDYDRLLTNEHLKTETPPSVENNNVLNSDDVKTAKMGQFEEDECLQQVPMKSSYTDVKSEYISDDFPSKTP